MSATRGGGVLWKVLLPLATHKRIGSRGGAQVESEGKEFSALLLQLTKFPKQIEIVENLNVNIVWSDT